LFATVIPEKLASQELDASVGASGPHDFAVREPALSSKALTASIASRLASVTIASRPSDRGGTGELVEMICPTGKAENFFEKDWTTQISLKVLAFSPLCRTPEIVGERAIRQGFGQMQPADFFGAIEVGERARDAQHAMIAAC
jgi:hypothetical protein